jgi:hypothetical protein
LQLGENLDHPPLYPQRKRHSPMLRRAGGENRRKMQLHFFCGLQPFNLPPGIILTHIVGFVAFRQDNFHHFAQL